MSDVKVRITAENQGLKDGLSKAKADVDKFAKETEGAFSGLSGKLAAVFSVGAIIGAGRAIFDFVGGIQDTSDALDMSAESVQGLSGAFAQSGVNAEKFAAGMAKLNQTVQEARDGNDKMIGDFGRLGVKWEDIRDKSPEDILYQIADGMHDATDPTEALAAAMAVLGKAGKSMAAELRGGSAALREHRDEVYKLTAAEVAEVDAAGDMITVGENGAKVLGSSVLAKWVNFGQTVVDKVLPTLRTPAPTPDEMKAQRAAAKSAPEDKANNAAWERYQKALADRAAGGAAAAPQGDKPRDPRLMKSLSELAAEQAAQAMEAMRGDMANGNTLRDRAGDRREVDKVKADEELNAGDDIRNKAREDYAGKADLKPEQKNQATRDKHRYERRKREFDTRDNESDENKRRNGRQLPDRSDIQDNGKGGKGGDDKPDFKDLNSTMKDLDTTIKAVKDKLSVA